MVEFVTAGHGAELGAPIPLRPARALMLAYVMRRREFIMRLGIAAVVWLAVARAQCDRVQRIGLLAGFPESNRAIKEQFDAFQRGLEGFGWLEGSNIEIPQA